MRIIRDFHACPEAYKGAVVALGNFDGVHRGHQAILSACIRQAAEYQCKAAVMTFEPHPREFFTPGHPPMRIYPLYRKLQLLKEMGNVDIVFLARFNRALASTTAENFVEKLLHKQLNVKHVVTGYNFAFGKGREGNTDYLKTAAERLGFGFTRVPQINDENDKPISSSAIRALLSEGDVQKAGQLLGRSYRIGGRVRHGDKRGRELGFPTANVSLETLFPPKFGIYAARVIFADGKACDAVANLGIRPMFKLPAPLLEVHCFDTDHAFYGERIEVELVSYLREEKQFDSVEQLRAQMTRDVASARSILEQRNVAYS